MPTTDHLTKAQYVRVVSEHAIFNRVEVIESFRCGCYHCGSTFDASDIVMWTDGEETAVCPQCFLDTVIGDSVFRQACNKSVLDHMNWYGFGHILNKEGTLSLDRMAPCEQCIIELEDITPSCDATYELEFVHNIRSRSPLTLRGVTKDGRNMSITHGHALTVVKLDGVPIFKRHGAKYPLTQADIKASTKGWLTWPEEGPAQKEHSRPGTGSLLGINEAHAINLCARGKRHRCPWFGQPTMIPVPVAPDNVNRHVVAQQLLTT